MAPHETILRLPAVMTRTGLSRSSLYLRISQGTFPKPISLGARSIGFPESEISAWVENRIKNEPRESGCRMSAVSLLDRLTRVKRAGKDRWMACCPAHSDGTASLSIRQLEDGRTLVHCFAGCDVVEVLKAVQLDLTDLFPARNTYAHGRHRLPPERRPVPPMDVMRCIAFEAIVVASSAASMRSGRQLTGLEHDRLICAAERLQAAVSFAEGKHGKHG